MAHTLGRVLLCLLVGHNLGHAPACVARQLMLMAKKKKAQKKNLVFNNNFMSLLHKMDETREQQVIIERDFTRIIVYQSQEAARLTAQKKIKKRPNFVFYCQRDELDAQIHRGVTYERSTGQHTMQKKPVKMQISLQFKAPIQSMGC